MGRTRNKKWIVLLCAFWFGLAGAQAAVELGIDVLASHDYSLLKGKRVGLITNQTGADSSGTKTRLLLKRHCNLVALYTPEHGLDGTEKAGRYVKSRRDRVTGVMAYSLYGPTRKPTPEMLRGVDVLVFDLQDIGSRSYTYISTMGRCMEAAGENKIPFVVLDRPNPVGGLRIEGPLGRAALAFVCERVSDSVCARAHRWRAGANGERTQLDRGAVRPHRRANARLAARHDLERYRPALDPEFA